VNGRFMITFCHHLRRWLWLTISTTANVCFFCYCICKLTLALASASRASYGKGRISLTAQAAPTSSVVPLTIKTSTGYTGDAVRFLDTTGSTKCFITSTGTLVKQSGTFDIKHPLALQPSKRLRHSFVESPLVDNLYSGTAQFANSQAVVNIDEQFNMSTGTFVVLTTNARVLVSCNGCLVAWNLVGAVLTITCMQYCDNTAAEASYRIIAERADISILQNEITDDSGHLLTEYKARKEMRTSMT
jgi:hypothetical protein